MIKNIFNICAQENIDDGEESAVAIEVRPRSRLFKSFPVPPAKWTVAVFRSVRGQFPP